MVKKADQVKINLVTPCTTPPPSIWNCVIYISTDTKFTPHTALWVQWVTQPPILQWVTQPPIHSQPEQIAIVTNNLSLGDWFILLQVTLTHATSHVPFSIMSSIRGMLKTLSIIHWVKLLQPFSQFTRKRQVSAYCHGFKTIIWSLCSKMTPASFLYVKKMAEGALLNVLWMGFSSSPFH